MSQPARVIRKLRRNLQPLAVLLTGIHISLLAAPVGCAHKQPARAPASPAVQTLALIERAEAAEKKREYLQAQSLYAQAKYTAPDDVSRAHAARTYARALIFYGEHQRAAVELTEAAKLEPGDAGTWHDLGMIRHALADLAGAETAFRRSVQAAPGDGRSRIALAALLMKQKRHQEALVEYRALLTIDLPEPVRKKVRWAVDVLERRLSRAPRNRPAHRPYRHSGRSPP